MIRCCLSPNRTFLPTVSSVLVPVYEHELWPPKRSATPNEVAVRAKADAVLAEGVTAAVPVMLDVEQYSVDVRLDAFHINPDTIAFLEVIEGRRFHGGTRQDLLAYELEQ